MGVFSRDNKAPAPRVPSILPTTFPGFPSSYTPAESANFNTPRALTAAAVQIPLNDKGEAERFKHLSDVWARGAEDKSGDDKTAATDKALKARYDAEA